MNMNNLDIFGKVGHVIFCRVYFSYNLENFKKSEGLQNCS